MADPSSHKLDLRVGGKYRLGKKIGSGSFGELARHSHNVHVADRSMQAISTSVSTSSPARRLPSSSSPSRPSIPSSSTSPRSTRLWLVALVSPLSVGSGQSATTMPWSSTSSDLHWRICSTFATASSASRLCYSWLINWYVHPLCH